MDKDTAVFLLGLLRSEQENKYDTAKRKNDIRKCNNQMAIMEIAQNKMDAIDFALELINGIKGIS